MSFTRDRTVDYLSVMTAPSHKELNANQILYAFLVPAGLGGKSIELLIDSASLIKI